MPYKTIRLLWLIACVASTSACSIVEPLLGSGRAELPAVGSDIRDAVIPQLQPITPLPLPAPQLHLAANGLACLDDANLTLFERYQLAADGNTRALTELLAARAELHQALLAMHAAGVSAEQMAELYRELATIERRDAALGKLLGTGMLGIALLILTAGTL